MQAHQQGMTLLEVMVSLALLASAALTAATLQLKALQANQQAQRSSQAVWLAHTWLEWERAGGDLGPADRARWQNSIVSVLGARAEGRVHTDSAQWRVELHWPDGQATEPRSLSLNGARLP